jgi:hypothetical protein
MATPAQATPFFYAMLNTENKQATTAAGAKWLLYPLSFFFADEIGLDLGIKRVMLQILAMEHAKLPSFAWNNLELAVNRATAVNEAIVTISQISSTAIH